MSSESHPSSPRGGTSDAIDWQRAWAEHHRWLRTIVLARVGDAQAADDVLQEVALAICRSTALPTDPAKAAPWLYRVAIRQALLYRRTCGRARKLRNQFAERMRPDEADFRTPDPLAWLLGCERQRRIREVLGQLPRRDAEVLLLKYTEGWSYRQLAERLGTTEAAVESRLHRARARLRDALAAAEILETR